MQKESTCTQHFVQMGTEDQVTKKITQKRHKDQLSCDIVYISHSKNHYDLSTAHRCVIFDDMQCNSPWSRNFSWHYLWGLEGERCVSTLGPLNHAATETQRTFFVKCRPYTIKDNEDFFTRLVTGSKSWLHYHTPDNKRWLVQWKHTGSPHSKIILK